MGNRSAMFGGGYDATPALYTPSTSLQLCIGGTVADIIFYSDGTVSAGDIAAVRPSAPTTGVIYFGNTSTRYLYYDGTQYNLNAAALTVGGTVTSAQNFASSTTAAVLATTGAGTIYLRPNGVGSTTGQAILDSAGGISTSGAFTAGSTVSDSIGDLRDIPIVLRNSTTAFTSADRGKCVYKNNTTAYTWTINTGGSGGWAITCLNAGTAGNITIAKGAGMTSLIDSAGVDANYTLAPGRSVTILCISSTLWRVL
jgi:hypothetical protein